MTALPHLRGAVYHDDAGLVFKQLGDRLPGQLVPRRNLSGGYVGFVCGFDHKDAALFRCASALSKAA